DPSLAATAAFTLRLPRPTDANGVTVIDSLTPGGYRIEVIGRPEIPATRIEIADGQETTVSIPL
ncbi:MAG: hypothetical protein R3344_13445, partial [Acidobacteriota bacterium]|nr:hypothetical protein [Acidobacteriota bacterium]